MIPKNEALKLAGFDETPTYFQTLLTKVYDSIGTCGECVHYMDHTCALMGGIPLETSDYCSRFLRLMIHPNQSTICQEVSND